MAMIKTIPRKKHGAFEKCKNKSNTKEPPKKSPKVPKLP